VCRRGKAVATRLGLGEELGVLDTKVDELSAALDWLGGRQKRIENKLAKRHLAERGSRAVARHADYRTTQRHYTATNVQKAAGVLRRVLGTVLRRIVVSQYAWQDSDLRPTV
jgi:hypothetical protein